MSLFFKKNESTSSLLFEKVKDTLKSCDGVPLMVDKFNIHYTPSNGKVGVELDVNTVSYENIIIANVDKKPLNISFATRNSERRFEVMTLPTTYKLRPNEAHEFQVGIKPLCTCSISENILVVATNKKAKYTQPVAVEFITTLSNYFDYHDFDEREFLSINEFKDMTWRGDYKGKSVIIDYRTNENLQTFEREVSVLRGIKCPTIVFFHGACHIPHHECIITEGSFLGSLSKMFNSVNAPSEKVRVKICLDVAKAVFYIHENGILHRDIKPENVSIVSLEDSIDVNAKLGGFTKSRPINTRKQDNEQYSEDVGTPSYMSPELIHHQKYCTRSDIFSLGITMLATMLWCILCGDDDNLKAVREQERLPDDLDLPQAVVNVINGCVKKNQKERMDMLTVVTQLQSFHSTM